MVTAGILPFRENSHGRTGNRTRGLMISSQRLWPLDHEAGHVKIIERDISLLNPSGSQTFKIWKFKFCMPVTELPKIKSSSNPMLYIRFMNLNILYAKMNQFIFLPIKKSAYITWNILCNCTA